MAHAPPPLDSLNNLHLYCSSLHQQCPANKDPSHHASPKSAPMDLCWHQRYGWMSFPFLRQWMQVLIDMRGQMGMLHAAQYTLTLIIIQHLQVVGFCWHIRQFKCVFSRHLLDGKFRDSLFRAKLANFIIDIRHIHKRVGLVSFVYQTHEISLSPMSLANPLPNLPSNWCLRGKTNRFLSIFLTVTQQLTYLLLPLLSTLPNKYT